MANPHGLENQTLRVLYDQWDEKWCNVDDLGDCDFSWYVAFNAFQAGKDAQLEECCDKFRARFDDIGKNRAEGIAAWLKEQCRPKVKPLKEQLLSLLDTCDNDSSADLRERSADLRKRIEALPDDLGTTTTERHYDY